MTKYLLDTSVLSAFAPDKPAIPERFAMWFADLSDAVHVSAVSFVEIEQGLRKLRRAGGEVRADRLSEWLDHLGGRYRDRIVPVDLAVSREAGRIGDAALAIGRHPGLADVLIAASADVRSLVVLTRNLRHFEPLGVPAVDPFAVDPFAVVA